MRSVESVSRDLEVQRNIKESALHGYSNALTPALVLCDFNSNVPKLFSILGQIMNTLVVFVSPRGNKAQHT